MCIRDRVDPEAVTGALAQTAEVLAEQLDAALARYVHPAQQAQQCGLATAAGALEKQGLASFEAECRNIQQRRLSGPGEDQVMQFDQRLAHSEHDRSLGWRGFRAFLAIGADQLNGDFLGSRECLEQRSEVYLR